MEKTHPLTGTEATFLQEGLADEHAACFQQAVLSLARALEVLMTSQDQPWVCASCMWNDPNHRMMSTTQDPACKTCGIEMAVSISTWSMQWLRSLMSRGGFGIDAARESTLCNFAQVGEHLLAPHGEKKGMVYLTITEPGEQATCACERQVEVDRSTTPQVQVAGSSRDMENGEDVDMDTGDAQSLLKGATKIVPQFSKLCSLANLCARQPEDYPQELLSSRLQGDEIKEALAIAIMLKHKSDKPGEPPLRWMPTELLAASDSDIGDRQAFLTRKSLIPTVREKKAGVAMEKFKGTEVKPQLKRKLERTDDEEVSQQRQPKRVKLFTTTPAEMVKIFAQFAQAQADGGHRRMNPVRTMETLVDRILDSRPNQHPPEVVDLTADQVGVVPAAQVAGSNDGILPAVVPATQHAQVGALGTGQNAALANTRGGGGRGGGRGRGRAGHRGANNYQGNQVSVPNDLPVRCSHRTATGALCRTENFHEALWCRGCNGRLQGQPLASSQRGSDRGGQGRGWQGRARRARGGGYYY